MSNYKNFKYRDGEFQFFDDNILVKYKKESALIYLKLKKAEVDILVSCVHPDYVEENLDILDKKLTNLLPNYDEFDRNISKLVNYTNVTRFYLEID